MGDRHRKPRNCGAFGVGASGTKGARDDQRDRKYRDHESNDRAGLQDAPLVSGEEPDHRYSSLIEETDHPAAIAMAISHPASALALHDTCDTAHRADGTS